MANSRFQPGRSATSRRRVATAAASCSCAAQEVAVRLLVPLSAVVIEAPDWPGQVGITDRGALLVRPDQIGTWRAPIAPPDPADDLIRALARVLGRTVG
ncbi:hypothetical protein AB0E01_05500 [Nocardia vinacea]|uniref:aromatic-ring hydroxylase C-terminal domain-containing protein n=1 Tax=Nocardia vinacea TaxID=96468 RepID=UPI0033EA1232